MERIGMRQAYVSPRSVEGGKTRIGLGAFNLESRRHLTDTNPSEQRERAQGYL